MTLLDRVAKIPENLENLEKPKINNLGISMEF